MKTIERELDIKPASLRMLEPYLGGKSYGVFDIETTGLSPAYSSIILSGFVIVRDGRAVLKQFFASHPSQEPDVIKASLAEIADLDYLVTFNGRMFDIPFLIKRAAKFELLEASQPEDLFSLLSDPAGIAAKKPDIRTKYDLDLFVIMKYYSDLPGMIGSMSQKNLERFMGISDLRDDEISGEESVRLYQNYVNFPTREAEESILLHNSDDVCQLTRLLPVLTRSDIHRAMSKGGFPVRGGIVKSVQPGRDSLLIKGKADRPMEYFSFPSQDRPYDFYMSGTDGSFTITLPLESEAGALYVDLVALLGYGHSVSESENVSEVSIPCEIAELPGFVNGYLLIKDPMDPGRTDWLGLNLFAKHLAERILSETVR